MRDRRMFPEDLAIEVLASGDTKYRPSSGTEGDMFQHRWCRDCTRDDYEAGMYCPIILQTLAFDEDDDEYPEEWTYDAAGQPCCTAFDPYSAEDL